MGFKSDREFLRNLTVGAVGTRQVATAPAVRFGEKLRKARTQKAFSQERLAHLSGLHRTYISSIERGERNISINNIEKLAKALGVGMADLMP